ncbi:MAG: murein transglycosylase A [Sphingomonadaceae bacterium]
MIGNPGRFAPPGLLALLVLAACAAPRPTVAPSPPPAVEAAGAGPGPAARIAALPADFAADREALEAFRRACPRLLRRADPSGLARPEDWRNACALADTATDPTAFFARHFIPVRLGSGRGLATGYYEPDVPAFEAPRAGAAPVLARPPELVDIDLSAFPGDRSGTIRGMVRGSRVVPAPDRAAIEGGALAGRGLEIAWAADPIDLFFLQIQGSGSLVFPDGRRLRIGYAGQNGHPYVAIGRLMRERGLHPKPGMAEIRAHLAADREAGAALMRENPSYVFFAPLDPALDGPVGSLGVPLLPLANAAADPETLPLGAPVWLETEVEGAPFRRLVIAADTGGAIRGANRFDIFFGPGPDAARKAGSLAAPVEALVLLPRSAAGRLP